MSAIITALGARSPAGLNAEQTAMGIRFSHLSPQRTKFEDSREVPIGMSLLSALPPELEGVGRMIELCAPALSECAAADALGARSPSQSRPIVLLGCPSPRPGLSEDYAAELLARVVKQAKIDADPELSAAFPTGHASFAAALERALQILPHAGTAPILVGCVDSYYDTEAVAFFESEMRIFTPDTTDGFLPSEGAAFVALRSTAPASAPFGEVVLSATGLERTVTQGKPNLARASTELLDRAIRALSLGSRPLGWYLRTTNRERHRAREERFVATRFPESFDPDITRMDELAEHLGDCGAATGALLAVYVCQGFVSGYAPDKTAVLSLSSDGPERGVVVLRGASSPRSEPTPSSYR